jgi:hypothetical protein
LFLIACASLRPQTTEPRETETRLAFFTESNWTLQEIEPSETVKFIAGPTEHGWHCCASLQPLETKPHETETRLAFLTESSWTLQEMEPSETVKFSAGPTQCCASLRPQKTEHETESRLAFSTESTSILLDMEPSETVKFLAGPTHGLSLIRGFFLAWVIIQQKKITTDWIGELKE